MAEMISNMWENFCSAALSHQHKDLEIPLHFSHESMSVFEQDRATLKHLLKETLSEAKATKKSAL